MAISNEDIYRLLEEIKYGRSNRRSYNRSSSSNPSTDDNENDGYYGTIRGVEQYSEELKELQDQRDALNNLLRDENDGLLKKNEALKEQIKLEKDLIELKEKLMERNRVSGRLKRTKNTAKRHDLFERLGDIDSEIEEIERRRGLSKDQEKEIEKKSLARFQADLTKSTSEQGVIEKEILETENELVATKIGLYEEQRRLNKELYYQTKEIEQGLTASEKMERSFERMGVNTGKFRNGLNELKSSFNGLVDLGKKFLEPWSKADQAASDFAKHIGLSGDQYEKFRRQIITTSASRNIGAKTGVSLEEQFQNIGTYSEAIGRNVGFSADQQEDMAHAIRLGQDGGKLAQNYMQALERFGMGPDSAIGKMSDLFKMSQKGGVAFNKTSEIFLNNIKLAQNYTFKKGVDGLMQMAKRSAEIKMNLNEVAKYVEKTSTLEGSLQSAAGLSVLGGPFAAGADPITMLYNGLNDFEGASKQMEGMLKSLVHFDESTKQLEMSSFNRMRLRAAAEAMGVDYGALSEQAFALGREERIKPILEAKGITSESDDYQAILNKAYLDKEGNAKVNINGEAVDVDKLTKEQISDLKRTDFSDSDNIRTITSTLLGWDDKLKGVERGVDEQIANTAEVTNLGNKAKDILDLARDNTELLAGIKMGVMAIQGLMMLGGIGNGIGNMGRGLFGGGGGSFTTSTKIGGSGHSAIGSLSRGGGAGLSGAFNSGMGYKNAKNTVQFANKLGLGEKATKGLLGMGNAASKAGAVMGTLGTAANYAMLGYIGKEMVNEFATKPHLDWIQNRKDNENDISETGEKAAHIGISAGEYGLLGAGTGAAIGTLLGGPGIGTAIGAGVGLVAGGIKGYIDADNAQIRRDVGRKLGLGKALQGDYTNNQLNNLRDGKLDSLLVKKLKEEEGVNLTTEEIVKRLNPKKMAFGGILRGRGNGTSDDNLVRVSNGEYIMPEKQTVKPNNRKILDAMRGGVSLVPGFKDGGEVSIDPQGNQMNVMRVSENTTNNNSKVEINKPIVTDVKLSPLTINGTIKLEMNGATKDINANELIKNPFFLRKLTDEIAKNLNVQNHFGYDKETYYKKFG